VGAAMAHEPRMGPRTGRGATTIAKRWWSK